MKYNTVVKNKKECETEIVDLGQRNAEKTNEINKLKKELQTTEETSKRRGEEIKLLEAELAKATSQSRNLQRKYIKSKAINGSPIKRSQSKSVRSRKYLDSVFFDKTGDGEECYVGALTTKDINSLLKSHKLDTFRQEKLIDWLERAQEAMTHCTTDVDANDKLTEEKFITFF